ncbi:MAG: DUF2764 family protein [Candidatus Cloacimonetes bacterium]|nr:DUF2764 family protein [Candidatus Cloacimonadota bacterium]
MNQDYFYFISGLPNISFEDNKLSYTLEQFWADAKLQLNKADYATLETLHLSADLDTLLRILYKTGKDPHPDSLLPPEYWEDYLSFQRQFLDNKNLELPQQFKNLPQFIAETIGEALSKEDLQPILTTEYQLVSGLYKWTSTHSNAFIRKWFAYDAHLRNILVAINGRKFNIPFAEFLTGEDELVENLSKSHAADFGLGKEDELFESLMRIYDQNNILYRERNYDILRWKWIDNQNFFNYFNLDRVLGYYCKLRILSRWLKADPNLGKEVFHDTLNAMENSFSFPEEFNIKSIRK